MAEGKGRVKSIVPAKDCLFIELDVPQGGAKLPDAFCRLNTYPGTPQEGDMVEFIFTPSSDPTKGGRVTKIKNVTKSPQAAVPPAPQLNASAPVATSASNPNATAATVSTNVATQPSPNPQPTPSANQVARTKIDLVNRFKVGTSDRICCKKFQVVIPFETFDEFGTAGASKVEVEVASGRYATFTNARTSAVLGSNVRYCELATDSDGSFRLGVSFKGQREIVIEVRHPASGQKRTLRLVYEQ